MEIIRNNTSIVCIIYFNLQIFIIYANILNYFNGVKNVISCLERTPFYRGLIHNVTIARGRCTWYFSGLVWTFEYLLHIVNIWETVIVALHMGHTIVYKVSKNVSFSIIMCYVIIDEHFNIIYCTCGMYQIDLYYNAHNSILNYQTYPLTYKLMYCIFWYETVIIVLSICFVSMSEFFSLMHFLVKLTL